MLTTKGKDFVRYALKPTSYHDRDVFLHSVANKVAGGTKIRPTELNIFNFVADRRSAYIRTGISDVFLTPMIVSWLTAQNITRFTAEQAALITAQLRGQSVMLSATPGTGKTFAAALATCHKFMHSTITTRCHTLYIAPSDQAARGMARIIGSVAGKGESVSRVFTTMQDLDSQIQGLQSCQPHVLIGTVSTLTKLLGYEKEIFGMKIRRLIDTLIVDEADYVLEQNGGCELIERLYRREREEISAQLIFLSATIDSETQRRFNLLTKNENNVMRLGDSHFQYNLPEGASFYLYCNQHLPQEKILLRLLKNIHWMKGKQFRPLIVTRDTSQSHALEQAFLANGLKMKNDSTQALNSGFLGEVQDAMTTTQRNLEKSIADECSSGIALSPGEIRTTDVDSLRGVSYSDVSDVFLIGGIPSSKTFVHVAGRTARFGSLGDVNIIFSPNEAKEMHELCEVHELPFKVSQFE